MNENNSDKHCDESTVNVENLESTVFEFEEDLLSHQVDMPDEFAKLIEKYFWELF